MGLNCNLETKTLEDSAEINDEKPKEKGKAGSSKKSSVKKPSREDSDLENAKFKMRKCSNNDLKKLFDYRIGIHHAGMVRPERTLMETLFAQGILRLLVCTSTLAWGVNLPAHTVIIKGTQIYDASKGGWVDVGMLDVMQIFGRAGRPQFDTSGEGIIITTTEKLPTYLSLLTHQLPIESQFINALPDNLNAEIILGTVTNVKEALTWLSYTYLCIRILKNPLKYGVNATEQAADPTLLEFRKKMIAEAAKKLMACKMIRYDSKSGNFFPTDLGRISSHFYINHESIMTYNEMLHPNMSDEEIFHLISVSKEFEQLQVREDEQGELNHILKNYCFVDVMGGPVHNFGKAIILMQAYLSRAKISTSSLISDSYYVTQNVGRICRALFQICLKFGWSGMASRLLTFCRMFDRQIWAFESPLRQIPQMKIELIMKIEQKQISLDKILDMSPIEVGGIINHERLGATVHQLAQRIPRLSLEAFVRPLTRSVLMIRLSK
jgi:activating signal cointegrator complex subunit 3